MPKGRKKSHKGGHRHFTNEEQIAANSEKVRREREWRKQRGMLDSDEEEEEAEAERALKKTDEDSASSSSAAAAAATAAAAAATTSSGSAGAVKSYGDAYGKEESDEESSEEEEEKHKGVEHLIEVENPNRVKPKTKKVTDLDQPGAPVKTELSRREREEIEKQQSKERYMKMHMAGKTDEARADLARLAIIRKQREDAMKKKNEEKLAREAKEAKAKKK